MIYELVFECVCGLESRAAAVNGGIKMRAHVAYESGPIRSH